MKPRIIFRRILQKKVSIIDANQLMCARAQSICVRKQRFSDPICQVHELLNAELLGATRQ